MSSVSHYRYLASQPLHYQQDIPVTTPPPPPNNNMSSQRFCLRWNNHQSNLLTVFDQLLHNESFVDVTLAVDGQLLRAHKIVLSACSPYFQAILVDHPDKHPVVILKDVPYSDMRSLLDFMYRGEVSVDQDRLTAFLRVAENLQIKGLTEVNEEKCDSIASSLSQRNQLSNFQQFQQQQQQNKRFANSLNMLSSALLQPKRKRGRPRKLSGSSNGTPGDEFDSNSNNLVQGSPEMLEVKMGMDGFTGNNSDGGSTGRPEIRENDTDDVYNRRVKEEPTEPVAGTSKEHQHLQRTYNNTKNSENDLHISDATISQQLLALKQEIIGDQSSIHTNDSSLKINATDNLNNNNNNNNNTMSQTVGGNLLNAVNTPTDRPPAKRRVRRRATSQSQDPAEQLTEMSVRGLNLFRYASINEGVYQCTECAKVDIQKTFKNKYSFQRHAFLYHEGHQRKVFPCPVCQKEFSRPDKMKNHMKTVHDCFMPKEVVFPPIGFYPIP